jgi:hypothetical protein
MKIRPYTAEECDTIRQDFAAFVPVRETAAKLGRTIGTVRQKIMHLGLRRSGYISRALPTAPEHLRALADKISPLEWREKFHNWQREQRNEARERWAQAQAQEAQVLAEESTEIDARSELTRDVRKNSSQARRWPDTASHRHPVQPVTRTDSPDKSTRRAAAEFGQSHAGET